MLLAALLALAAAGAHAGVYPVTQQMRTGAAAIIDSFLPASGVTANTSLIWQRLAYITDTFGPRPSGSQAL